MLRLFLFLFSVVAIGLNPATYSICEDAGNVSVTLSAQAGNLDRDVIVTLTTMNSTAMCECRTMSKKQKLLCKVISIFVFVISPAGKQYTHISTNVTLNASVSTQNVTIPILNNGVVAESVLFSIVLTSADPAVVLHPETADVIIEDDDCELSSSQSVLGVQDFTSYPILSKFSCHIWIESIKLFSV